jgi:DNA-binding CsgD family transcriptional regulator
MGALIGRAHELARLTEFAGSLNEGPAAMVISGEPGIGKTALLRECVSMARAAGHTVLLSFSTEEEMTGPLVGINDLFDGTRLGRDALDPATEPNERGRAILAAIRDLTLGSPCLIAIDDVKWLDAASAQALRFALRRITDEPLGLVMTCQTRSDAGERLDIDRYWPASAVTDLEPGPLDEADLRRVIGEVVDSISPIAFGHIARLSGGNPFHAIQLARSIDPTQTYESAAAIQLPDSLQGAIESRLNNAPDDLIPLLEVLSATGPGPVERFRRYLPDADVHGLITIGESSGYLARDGDKLHFAHPLLASAVYGRIDAGQRRSLHARLAAIETDAETRTWHLALSADLPSEEIAALLEASAGEANGRGAPDLASFYAHHSRRLTPPEYLESSQRRALLEARSLAKAGEAARALALLDEMATSLPRGSARAEVLVHRFYVENDEIDAGDATLVEALEDAEGDEVLRGRVLDILGWHRGMFRGDLRGGIKCAREAVEIAETTEATDLWMLAAGHLAHMEAISGRPRLDVMQTAVAVVEERGGPELGGGPEAWLAKQQLWAGALDDAEETFQRLTRSANRLELPYRLYDLALADLARGRLDSAHDHVERGVEAARDSDNADPEGWLLYPLSLVLAWRGDSVQARSAAERLDAWEGRPGNKLGRLRATSALGLLALSEGDAAGAGAILAGGVALADDVGLGHPGAVPILPDAIAAHAAIGEAETARRWLEELGRQASSLGHERTWALFNFAYGMTLLAEGEADSAAEALAESVAMHESLGLVPDTARGRLALGQALVRLGQRNRAQEQLEAARATFESMGATLWLARARGELERSDPRPGRGTLTVTEERIADLVARGRRNREIANDLFMSVATVEAHLTRIYRKLGIRSRAELTRMVMDGTVAVGPLTPSENE